MSVKTGSRLTDARAWLVRNAPLVTLAVLVIGSVVLILALCAGLTFYQDTWEFLMYRRGWSVATFLDPHNEHIVLLPVAIEKLLLAVFGMTTAAPEYVVSTLLLAITAVLVFEYVRRRLGPWPGVMAAAVILFLGPAWQVLLWPFEIGFVGSMLGGVAMLLALDREDRRGDIWVAVALTVSLAFSSLGLSFVFAAAIDVWQRRAERGLRRAYAFGVPLFLYLVWYAGWGHTAEHHLTLHNLAASPVYLVNGLASSLDTILGLSTISLQDIGQPEWGRPLLIAALILIAFQQTRRPGFSKRLWPVLGATVSYWLLAAFNYIPGREAVSSRYSYAGAIFTLLVLAELIRRSELSARRLCIAGVVAAAAVSANLVPLKQGQKLLKEQTVLTKADTAAIEMASRTVSPDFGLTPEIAGTGALVNVYAREYLPAVAEFGSPAYTPRELGEAPALGRRQADLVLSDALPITNSNSPGVEGPTSGPGCASLRGGASIVTLDTAKTYVQVDRGPEADLALGRFAEAEFPVGIPAAPGGTTTVLRIPRDHASRHWRLEVTAAQPVRVCPAGG